ncbi:large ribosomal subunit protein uL6-like isoform X2 [Coffea arabica]|uniref:Large ribosomal subunit protein uL6-like isoform X2 n=1 Tax=Coffea arabica TaxID=13443 RepID=A0ABM4X6N6_COFAR
MKTILALETMDIPGGVKIKMKAKQIEVEGPRRKLTRNFKHLNLDFQLITDEVTGKRKLKVDTWFGSCKTTAAIRTALSHVENLITDVTKGYCYKMRFVYAHFPINASITNSNRSIEIRNFLGEKKSVIKKKYGQDATNVGDEGDIALISRRTRKVLNCLKQLLLKLVTLVKCQRRMFVWKQAASKLRGVQVFTYTELEIATNKFSAANVIGNGGYGVVYRGILSDGTVAAIKMLHREGKQ